MRVEDNPRSIKYYVKRFFLREKDRFKHKKIIDFPAGSGVTSHILHQIKAQVIAFDLFPEYFQSQHLQCLRANINKGLPVDDSSVDALICQEGIEHFENQLGVLKEFNRVIKKGGSLIITAPNYSNMAGRLSYFLCENEVFHQTMPQNELDDIWMSQQNITSEIYYGHLFLIGVNKLRILSKLAGFKIKNIEKTRQKKTAWILFIMFYPFIFLMNWRNFRRHLRKNKNYSFSVKKAVYTEVFKLSISPTILLNSHIFIEFEKEFEVEEVKHTLKSVQQDFSCN